MTITLCGEHKFFELFADRVLWVSLRGPSPNLLKLFASRSLTKTVEETENPAYVAWIAQDQQLVAYLLSSMTKEILVQVSSCDHAAQLWTAITEMFSSQSRSRILQLRSQLSREKKGDLSASAYYSKMKGIADEMAAVGKKIDDDDLISYILNGLDSDYNPFVSSVSVKDSLSLGDLYAQLLSYEARLQQQRSDEGRFYSSANNATRGHGRGNFVEGVAVRALDVALAVMLHPSLATRVHQPHRTLMMAPCVNFVKGMATRYMTVGFVSTKICCSS